MSVKLISYDLRKPDRGYPALFAAIKSLGATWWHGVESVWMVQTPLTSRAIRDKLRPHLDSADKLLVTELRGGWATSGLDEKRNAWLRDNV